MDIISTDHHNTWISLPMDVHNRALQNMNTIVDGCYCCRALQHIDTIATGHYCYITLQHMESIADGCYCHGTLQHKTPPVTDINF